MTQTQNSPKDDIILGLKNASHDLLILVSRQNVPYVFNNSIGVKSRNRRCSMTVE